MPYKYSTKSLDKLFTCHQELQKIFREVIKHSDCTVLEGRRNKEKQARYFSEGKSKLQYPNSKHNRDPSRAIDVAPYPIDWDDWKRFYYFGGTVMGIANILHDSGQISHKIRWGGDWDRDQKFDDQKFNDLVHFELV